MLPVEANGAGRGGGRPLVDSVVKSKFFRVVLGVVDRVEAALWLILEILGLLPIR